MSILPIMDPAEHKNRKIYYSIGEVAEMFDVKTSLIRYWESKFDILKPHKNKKGNRMFTPADVDNLKLIHHLVREKGMTLAGARKRLNDNLKGSSRDTEIADRLMSIKAILMELREELNEVDGEIYRPAAEEWRYEEIPGRMETEYPGGVPADDRPPAPVTGRTDAADAAETTGTDGTTGDDYPALSEPALQDGSGIFEQSLFDDTLIPVPRVPAQSDAAESYSDEPDSGEEESRPRQIIEQTLF